MNPYIRKVQYYETDQMGIAHQQYETAECVTNWIATRDDPYSPDINSDKNNPFFGSSNCGYVGDAQKVIAAVVEQLRSCSFASTTRC